MVKDFAKFAKQYASSSIVDSYLDPFIVEERKLNATTLSVFSRLMMDRIIFLGTPINDDVANIIQAQLLYLQSISKEPINMYINTPGGIVSSGLGIYDTMNLIEPNVNTICTGMTASMGSVLLSAGVKRYILPHARVMIHQPSGGAYGMASDILIEAEEIKKCREELCNILATNCKQDYNKVLSDFDRDKWFSAEEALNYGLVDNILCKK